MRLATWNLNSIRARASKLAAWLDAHTPDCVLMQETKVVDDEFPLALFADRGYHVALHGQRSYNGVAIAARSPIGEVAIGLGDAALDDQARLIAGTIDGLRVVSVYVPNGQVVGSDKYGYKLAWLAALARWVERHDRAQPLVIGGDWNVAPADQDVHDPVRWAGVNLCSEPERAAVRELYDLGLADVFRRLHPEDRAFTWWDHRGANFFRDQGLRIDYFLADATTAARATACVVDRDARKGHDASDHAPVVLTVE